MRRLFLFWSVVFLFFVSGLMSVVDHRILIEEGDRLYAERSDLFKAYLAMKKYSQVLEYDPENYNALWKIARTAFFIAEIVPTKKKKWEVVEKGLECAKKAVELNNAGVQGHFWLGVLYTKVGEVKGILRTLFLIGPIKKAMRRVIEIDDSFAWGGAYTVLGRVYSKVPGIFGGSDKKARDYYERARQISPANTLNLLFLGETYWDRGEKQKAIQMLESLMTLEPDKDRIPEARKHRMEAKKLLKKYRG